MREVAVILLMLGKVISEVFERLINALPVLAFQSYVLL